MFFSQVPPVVPPYTYAYWRNNAVCCRCEAQTSYLRFSTFKGFGSLAKLRGTLNKISSEKAPGVISTLSLSSQDPPVVPCEAYEEFVQGGLCPEVQGATGLSKDMEQVRGETLVEPV